MALEDGAETQEKEGVTAGLVAPKTFILEADLTTAASEFMFEIQVEKDAAHTSSQTFLIQLQLLLSVAHGCDLSEVLRMLQVLRRPTSAFTFASSHTAPKRVC